MAGGIAWWLNRMAEEELLIGVIAFKSFFIWRVKEFPVLEFLNNFASSVVIFLVLIKINFKAQSHGIIKSRQKDCP